MLRILKFILPLTPNELSTNLIEEVNMGIADPCDLLLKLRKKEIFNEIYREEIQFIYYDDNLFTELIGKTRNLCLEASQGYEEVMSEGLTETFAYPTQDTSDKVIKAETTLENEGTA